MKLILISPSDKHDSEIPFLLNMFELGLPTYHLRKKNFSTKKLKIFLDEIPKKYHERIVIHTHHELARKFNLKGIYISRSHKKRKIRLWIFTKWLKFRKSKLEISATCKSIENIQDYISRYDYVFLSSIFDSAFGNFQSKFSEYSLMHVLKNTKGKVIARGGITAETIQKAHTMGFGGVAFYSSIWKTTNPVKEFIKAKEKFRELNIPIE